MKKLLFTLLFQTIILICSSNPVSAQAGFNIHIGENGVDIKPDEFINYYQAPPERIVWLQREKIPEEQWPLLFELARAGNVTPDRVWEIRRQQSNWNDVLGVINVPPSYFYYDVPSSNRLSPPYGKAYGYYRNHPTEVVRWSDSDLARLASVRFITESTHRPAHEAVVLYKKHPRFILIRPQEKLFLSEKHSHKIKNVEKNNHGHGENEHEDKHEKNQGHHGKHGHHDD